MREFLQIDLPQGGGHVSYAEYGDPDGRPMVFFHGWPSSRLQGRLCHEAGVEHGWRIIALDRPGIGRTEAPAVLQPRDLVPLVTGLADTVGLGEDGKFGVLGVSGGAPYVYACAHAVPDRLSCAGVVCGAVPLAEFSDLSEMMLPYRFLLWARQNAPWMVDMAMAAGQRSTRWSPDHPVFRALYRFIPPSDRCVVGDRVVNECVMESFREAMGNGSAPVIQDAEIYTQPWGFSLRDVQFPVHLWHGEHDRNIPASMAREVAEQLPQCTAIFHPEEGHYSLPAKHIGTVLETMANAAATRENKSVASTHHDMMI